MSHKGNSSAEPEAAPEKKSETESINFPIVASIFCSGSKIFLIFFFLFFLVSFVQNILFDETGLIRLERNKSYAFNLSF